jgi:NAD(P)-dependent dehydrogenase (short-subunit alcohol dehydrogenase family)
MSAAGISAARRHHCSLVRQHLRRNVTGALFTVQKALPLLVDGASIVLTGSTTSIKGTPNMTVDAATKAAIRNLARTWTLELKDRRNRALVRITNYWLRVSKRVGSASNSLKSRHLDPAT